MSEPHYVVLIGDVGAGKSTIVEKLCGVQDRSSNASESFTKESKLFRTPDLKLVISDTPGTNAMADKVAHNTQVAAALNYSPVSRMLIVVKADTRIDNVVDNVRKYAEQLADLDPDVIGVMVTHMDTVTWSRERFINCLDSELGISTAVFSGKDISDAQLLQDILGTCQRRFPLSIDGEEFFKLFKINNNNQKIIRTCKKQVDLFRGIKAKFDQERTKFPDSQQADLAFEFQAFMTEEITRAQKNVAEENNFSFTGESAMNEAGHVANMTNQLRAILYEVRMETLGHAKNFDMDGSLRKCPFCGEVWTLVEGCEGETCCGQTGMKVTEAANNNGVMATFKFSLRTSNVLESFMIEQSGEKRAGTLLRTGGKGAGCGRTITWKSMAPVQPPLEVMEATINTKDINVVPRAATSVKERVNNMLKGIKLEFGN